MARPPGARSGSVTSPPSTRPGHATCAPSRPWAMPAQLPVSTPRTCRSGLWRRPRAPATSS
eukprot:10555995-Lingulodinium_polyedra.AAC.1